jgi:iron complex transport system ATP-binding protein
MLYLWLLRIYPWSQISTITGGGGKMFKLENITYTIGKTKILENISFLINSGDFMCFMGANGAGKSTIIKILNGLLPPSFGLVSIGGKNISSYKKRELATLLAYVPQFSPKDIHYSVEEYILFGRYPHQKPFSGVSLEDKEAVEKALEATSLKDKRTRDIGTLSGGEFQRVIIAAALTQDTPILLLDEPTIYLDPKSSMQILEILAKIHAGGKTIVMVTHDINQALMFGTRFIGVKDGKIFFDELNVETLIDSGKLDNLFDINFYRVENQVLVRRQKKK